MAEPELIGEVILTGEVVFMLLLEEHPKLEGSGVSG